MTVRRVKCECDAPRCERDGCQDKPTPRASSLRPKRAGEMHYLWFGRDRQWFYAEWGNGVMVHFLGMFGVRFNFEAWRIR